MTTEQLVESEVDSIEDAVFSNQFDNIRQFFTTPLLEVVKTLEHDYGINIDDRDLLFQLQGYIEQAIDIGYYYPDTIPAIIIPVGEIEETEPSIIDQDCLEDWYINDQGYAYYSIPAVAIEIDIEKLVNEYYELNVKE